MTNYRGSLAWATLGSDLSFASFFQYSPRGSLEVSVKSQRLRDVVKAARATDLDAVARRIHRGVVEEGALTGFLREDAVLVPAPRSAPLVKGGLWPAERIARALVGVGLGSEVQPLLRRVQSVPKAAFAGPGERPTVARHVETLRADRHLGEPRRLIVVDDIITKGAMLAACGTVLRQVYPDAEVLGFAVVRTRGLMPEIDSIVAPCLGVIRLDASGEVHRSP